jgi:hypothetical protein
MWYNGRALTYASAGFSVNWHLSQIFAAIFVRLANRQKS